MYFQIFYKNIKIEWVLCEFYEPKVSKITKVIIKNTKETKIISYGNFLCNSEKDLKFIYKILKKESLKFYKEKEFNNANLPNLVTESIKQFISNDE